MESYPPPKRILIVEDNESLLDGIATAFRSEGWHVEASATYEHARDLLRRAHFDVLLTDVRLGAFNGLQLAVVARDTTPGVQIVVVSGFDDPVLRAEASSLGAVYLVKPVSVSELVQLVGRAR